MATGNFNANTRQSWLQGQPVTYAANATVSQQLQQLGFLSRIVLPFSVNFTTSSTGTFANTTTDPPTPYNFIKKIRVYTNEGQEIWNTSGYGAYLHEQIQSDAIDPRNPIASFNSTNTAAAIYQIPATYTTSTTYTINFYLYLDIAWNQSLQYGLIFLQNPTNRVTLEITYGDATSLISTGVGTITINSVVCNPLIEIFNLPQAQANWPALTYAHMCIEDSNNSIVGVGDNVYRPILGNTYLSIVQAFINNSTNMVPANFTNLRITYQGTQNSYTQSTVNQLIMQRNRYAHDLPDGVFVHDFRYGTGLAEVGNTRDVINTSLLTDLQFIATIGSGVTITQPAYYRAVREMLAPLTTANNGSSG